MDEQFPRELTSVERELLLWILPEDRPGYQQYRMFIENSSVVAKGRRGEGNYIIADPKVKADNDSPLPQIFAHGSIIAQTGELSVSIRERLEDQIEFEIAGLHGEVSPVEFKEIRRWTFSTWLPALSCPKCGASVREVAMSSERGQQLELAICTTDRMLWLYDARTGVNHPIPLTNYYNELMLHKNIRDPKIALDSKRLFTDLEHFSDTDLILALKTYNQLRMKVELDGNIVVPVKQAGIIERLRRAFRPGSSER
ncbi:MAG: hypothetical protein L0Y80_00635 [Ignavibacteriae bacterium]|nr:hypothetical protein [Ignavibacteriota bacterium]